MQGDAEIGHRHPSVDRFLREQPVCALLWLHHLVLVGADLCPLSASKRRAFETTNALRYVEPLPWMANKVGNVLECKLLSFPSKVGHQRALDPTAGPQTAPMSGRFCQRAVVHAVCAPIVPVEFACKNHFNKTFFIHMYECMYESTKIPEEAPHQIPSASPVFPSSPADAGPVVGCRS